jgi:hypothetical protein
VIRSKFIVERKKYKISQKRGQEERRMEKQGWVREVKGD